MKSADYLEGVDWCQHWQTMWLCEGVDATGHGQIE